MNTSSWRHRRERHEHEHHEQTPEWARHEFHRLAELIEESTLIVLAAIEAQHSTQPVSATVTFTNPQGVSMTDISVPDTQGTLSAAVAFKDADGNDTSPTGAVSWASSDESIATVDGSADPSGLTASVAILGPLGSASISATDGGSGVSGSSAVTVTAGPPVSAEVTFA